MIKLTIFTPTYNRKELLKRCYDSLKKQSVKEFIWLVVDDGSDDGTKEQVQDWIKERNEFEVEYIFKENGGLHTAYNAAIDHITTELCVCIDSDDYMPEKGVEEILNFWMQNGSSHYAGIVAPDCYPDGKLLGDPLPEQKSINLIDLLTGKYPIINGDRTNVVRTELYKRFAPMRVFPGEKNFNPHYLHLQISKEYDFLVMNTPLRVVEYQPEGMSASILKQYRNSPNSFAETRELYLSFPDTPLKFRFRHTVHLVSSCLLAGKPWKVFQMTSNKLLTAAAIIPGTMLTIYIMVKTK